jgi:hypothetical protein
MKEAVVTYFKIHSTVWLTGQNLHSNCPPRRYLNLQYCEHETWENLYYRMSHYPGSRIWIICISTGIPKAGKSTAFRSIFFLMDTTMLQTRRSRVGFRIRSLGNYRVQLVASRVVFSSIKLVNIKRIIHYKCILPKQFNRRIRPSRWGAFTSAHCQKN